jgi:hypothetical protein
MNDLPLAIYKRRISKKELSKYQRVIYRNISASSVDPLIGEKLIMDFNKKSHYIVYSKTLKYYISRAMIVTKVWKAIKYEKSQFLKHFIDSVIELRKKANFQNDGIGSELCKLMLNTIYGKFLSDSSSYVNLKVIISPAVH